MVHDGITEGDHFKNHSNQSIAMFIPARSMEVVPAVFLKCFDYLK